MMTFVARKTSVLTFNVAQSGSMSIPEEWSCMRELAEVWFYCHYLCPQGARLSSHSLLMCLRLPLCCREADADLHPSFSHAFIRLVVESVLQASASCGRLG